MGKITLLRKKFQQFRIFEDYSSHILVILNLWFVAVVSIHETKQAEITGS